MRREGRGFAHARMMLVVGVCGSFELPQKSGKWGGLCCSLIPGNAKLRYMLSLAF